MDIKTAAVRKLAELKKITTERAAKNPARYEKFSDRIKELIQQFNKGLIDAEGVLDAAEEVANGVAAEDQAHKGSGLPKQAFDIHAILERFKPPPEGVSEPEPPPPTVGRAATPDSRRSRRLPWPSTNSMPRMRPHPGFGRSGRR